MNTLLLYLMESTLCVSTLYAVYWFFLRRETFFQMNRFYLLSMVLLSVLLPLMPIRWTPSDPSAAMVVLLEPVMITPSKVAHAFQANLQWIEIATVVYFTGVLIFLFRFGLQLIQLHRITRRFGIRKRNGQRVVFVDRGYSPFSFFNLIFLNEAALPSESLSTILEHERIHIRQYHTADMILIELATLLQWFNPVIWLAGREMKSIHEYLADEGVLQNGISRPLYQQMILNETMGIQVNNLTNNFNVSLLKKRIAMMTKSKSKTWAKGKLFIALPALLVLLFMLTARSYTNADVLKVAGSPVFAPALAPPAPVPVTVFQDKQKQEQKVKYVAPVVMENGVYKVVEKMPTYPGGDEARVNFLATNIKYPEEAIKKNTQGTVYITFIIRADGSVNEVKVLRGIGSGCDEEAVRVIKLMPKWNPGQQKGKPVDVQFNLPINFRLDSHKKEEPKN
ncbi:MAG: M56 family metallopeptidase [Bacteroidetes bacterium]|nr:M56 family metallopeptidase [Bacteroidota bacterium]